MLTTDNGPRSGAWRSRWAAVGAAVAVTLGAGGVVAVNAATSAPSSFVSIEPTRILDTRTDVGLAGPFVSGVAQKLRVTGTVPTQPPGGAAPVSALVVPPTATSVVVNVTVIRPSTSGFLSIRPGDASGTPATSNINWGPGGPNIANAVTVQLPADGTVDIFVSGTVAEVLIDVAGYNTTTAVGPIGYQSVSKSFPLPAQDFAFETLDCPPGKVFMNATFSLSPNNAPSGTVTITQLGATGVAGGYVDVHNSNDFVVQTGRLQVLCVNAPS